MSNFPGSHSQSICMQRYLLGGTSDTLSSFVCLNSGIMAHDRAKYAGIWPFSLCKEPPPPTRKTIQNRVFLVGDCWSSPGTKFGLAATRTQSIVRGNFFSYKDDQGFSYVTKKQPFVATDSHEGADLWGSGCTVHVFAPPLGNIQATATALSHAKCFETLL